MVHTGLLPALVLLLAVASATSSEPGALKLASGWEPYGSGYRAPTVVKDGDWCFVSGMVKYSAGAANYDDAFAYLPEDCRPTNRLIFNANSGDQVNRVDVLASGEVRWIGGDTSSGWLSLDGIAFATTAGTSVAYLNGWQTNPWGYHGLKYWTQGSMCMVAGLMSDVGGVMAKVSQHISPGPYAQLPADCRPAGGHQLFSVNQGGGQQRVDVRTDGTITWKKGATGEWESVTGILFNRQLSGQNLASLGWKDFGYGYQGAQWWKVGDVCSLAGLVRPINRQAAWNELYQLPEECKPTAHLVFNINNNAAHARVDITPGGKVLWVSGGNSHNWLSLSGIAWMPKNYPSCYHSTGNDIRSHRYCLADGHQRHPPFDPVECAKICSGLGDECNAIGVCASASESNCVEGGNGCITYKNCVMSTNKVGWGMTYYQKRSPMPSHSCPGTHD